ncbi:hypothetical protein BZG36_01777 [Bifiguratus adelaidae]|uniref:RING-type domain-containing protein n=1 Tax=Bifiguratus adelaidae TaxID=1938954 RepID=A0A261Y3C9_9FUNG|nr:hypothetical protein BZG36_01777 [Bifiguratus adelaidae]
MANLYRCPRCLVRRLHGVAGRVKEEVEGIRREGVSGSALGTTAAARESASIFYDRLKANHPTPQSTLSEYATIHPKRLLYERVEPTVSPKISQLAHNLDRVLFNPGVHYLQDPRSKVFNYDPYLRHICPPSEFDYNNLWSMAKRQDKKYVGSTSSMSAVLSHFYFLISGWKPVNTSSLSSAFADQSTNFTRASRAPASIFLRYNDGVYAVDVDKSNDVNETILSVLGRSMEKMLTLSPEEFQLYRKENSDALSDDRRQQPESYAYGKIANFLLRSQLDCQDDRLPNKVFDLKTRAVVPVRLDQRNYMEYQGYQLKRSHGLYESFEREYYDMMRSAFLKYSFQVRIGHMDGVFVAFHNTARIFGFQYISLDEMDARLFGNSTIGQQAFKTSLQLLSNVLDAVTEKYPKQTLRISFETRAKRQQMDVFVEAVPDVNVTDELEKSSSDFFVAEEPTFNPYLPMTQYVLDSYSTVNKIRQTEPIDLDPASSQEWDVHYNLRELPQTDGDIIANYKTMRRRQMTYLSAPDKEMPLLSKLKRISRRDLEMLEKDDEEESILYQPSQEIVNNAALVKRFKMYSKLKASRPPSDDVEPRSQIIRQLAPHRIDCFSNKKIKILCRKLQLPLSSKARENAQTLKTFAGEQYKLCIQNILQNDFRRLVAPTSTASGPITRDEVSQLSKAQLRIGCGLLGESKRGTTGGQDLVTVTVDPGQSFVGIMLDFDTGCPPNNTWSDVVANNRLTLPVDPSLLAEPIIAVVTQRGFCPFSTIYHTAVNVSHQAPFNLSGIFIADTYATMSMNDSSTFNQTDNDITPTQGITLPIVLFMNSLGTQLTSAMQSVYPQRAQNGILYFFLSATLVQTSNLSTIGIWFNVTIVLSVLILVAIGLYYGIHRYGWNPRYWRQREREFRASEVARRQAAMARAELKLKVLKTADITKFPLIVYDPAKVKNSTCPICLDDFRSASRPSGLGEDLEAASIAEPNIVRLLPCRHGFCSACVDDWLSTKSSLCPVCKFDYGDQVEEAGEEPQVAEEQAHTVELTVDSDHVESPLDSSDYEGPEQAHKSTSTDHLPETSSNNSQGAHDEWNDVPIVDDAGIALHASSPVPERHADRHEE